MPCSDGPGRVAAVLLRGGDEPVSKPDSDLESAALRDEGERHVVAEQERRSVLLRRLPALAGFCRQQSVHPILTLDGGGEPRGDLSELGIRSTNRPDAPALADTVEFGDSLVEALPQLRGTSVTTANSTTGADPARLLVFCTGVPNWVPQRPAQQENPAIYRAFVVPLPGFEASYLGVTSAGSSCKSSGS